MELTGEALKEARRKDDRVFWSHYETREEVARKEVERDLLGDCYPDRHTAVREAEKALLEAEARLDRARWERNIADDAWARRRQKEILEGWD